MSRQEWLETKFEQMEREFGPNWYDETDIDDRGY